MSIHPFVIGTLGVVINVFSFAVFFVYFILQGNLFNEHGKSKKHILLLFFVIWIFGTWLFLLSR